MTNESMLGRALGQFSEEQTGWDSLGRVRFNENNGGSSERTTDPSYDFLFLDESGKPMLDHDEFDKLKEVWEDKIGVKLESSVTQAFANYDFTAHFLRSIPQEEWTKYVQNTESYSYSHPGRKQYDPNYVIAVRRAVPSDKPKPEAFWTTEFREANNGLGQEIRGAQREHSVIMVSTLQKLQEHGETTTNAGVTDGEIVIDPTKPFGDFLFQYKPFAEQASLERYLKNGGITRDALLKTLEQTAGERIRRQGFDLENSLPHSPYEESGDWDVKNGESDDWG